MGICVRFPPQPKLPKCPGPGNSGLPMADVFDKEKRSWVMSRITRKDTKPERLLRSLLHRHGFRFTVNGPLNKKLPGRPDIVLPKHKTIIFVHGCYWHGHKDCKHFRLPKSRTEWWQEKIGKTQERDARNEASLRAAGWSVLVVWECAFENFAAIERLEKRLIKVDPLRLATRRAFPSQKPWLW